MEKSREQFEKLARNNGLTLDMTRGCYSSRDTRMAWDVWQASRESLEVELPKEKHVKAYDFYTDGYNSGVDICEYILEDLNIKVTRK